MKCATEEAFVGANAFDKGAANTAYAQYFVGNSYLNPLTDPQVTRCKRGSPGGSQRNGVPGHRLPGLRPCAAVSAYHQQRSVPTKVALQCLPYIGYPPSLNAMGCIAKAAKQ